MRLDINLFRNEYDAISFRFNKNEQKLRRQFFIHSFTRRNLNVSKYSRLKNPALSILTILTRQTCISFSVMHISIILVSFVCASFAAICFKFGMNGFAHQCILYANITFKNVESPYTSFDNYTARMLPKNLSTIDNYYTIWGPQYLCDFCHFTIITSAIFSFIWGAFFVICGKGGSALETDE